MEQVLVTGGADFIGSHLGDRLIEKHDVGIPDDLSSGTEVYFTSHIDNDGFASVQG